MQIFVDECAYPEYVYLVPCAVEMPAPRYRTDQQKLMDEYLDAIIPKNFKPTLEIKMPVNKAVELGWDKRYDQLQGTTRVRAWLLPNDYNEAKEQKLIMDITVTDAVRDMDEVINHSLSTSLRHRTL